LVDMLKKNASRNGSMANPEYVDNPNNDDDDDQDDGNHVQIDIRKVQNVLEAAAGNLALAEQLFWDDYHATEQSSSSSNSKKSRQRHSDDGSNNDDENKPASKNGSGWESDNDEKEGSSEDKEQEDEGEEEEEEECNDTKPKSSKRLKSSGRSLVMAEQPSAQRPGRSRSSRSGARPNHGIGHDDDNNNNIDPGAVMNQVDESDILISDEDTSGRHLRAASRRLSGKKRIKTSAVAAEERSKQIKEAAESIACEVFAAKHCSRKDKDDDGKNRRRRRREHKETEEEDDPNDYISDDDWLGEEAGQEVKDVLWSNSVGSPSSSSSPRSDDDEEEEASFEGIPKTWLSVGFQLSECTTGLIVSPPDLDAVETMAWKMNRDAELRSQWPEPYHCKSITAILSIVTALLYTGASIQGDEVNCTTGRKPWADLTPEDRKRQFEVRLADALSSLIFIAAKSSLRRKEKSYLKVKQANKEKGRNITEEDAAHERRMTTRLHLIPVCLWNEQSDIATDPRGPGDALFQEVDIKTSLTNIKEIRPFVVSAMRSFIAPGGVALLIETIVRIHASGVVARNLAIARTKHNDNAKHKSASNTTSATSENNTEQRGGLIRCTCDERQRIKNGSNPLSASVRNDPIKLLDLTPPGTECVSTELLTLILTGRMEPTFENCTPAGLGFGLLTSNVGEVSSFLSRPEKPVWMLRGETCFSVLCIKDLPGNDHVDFKTISKVDKPGVTLDMMHWNCWYTGRKKSELRIITASESWIPPSTLSKLSVWEQQNQGDPLWSTNARRATLVHHLSVEEDQKNVTKAKKDQITAKELERLKFNPEDEKLYPGNYKMWRYDFGQEDDKDYSSSWNYYFRLSTHQKKVVELKMGPKINAILNTRWPEAKIGNFLPKDENLPIV
jgi:hypothetical protein